VENPPEFEVAFDVVIVDVQPVYKGSMSDALHAVKEYAAVNTLMVVYLYWNRMPVFLQSSPDWEVVSVDDNAPYAASPCANVGPVPTTPLPPSPSPPPPGASSRAC